MLKKLTLSICNNKGIKKICCNSAKNMKENKKTSTLHTQFKFNVFIAVIIDNILIIGFFCYSFKISVNFYYQNGINKNIKLLVATATLLIFSEVNDFK